MLFISLPYLGEAGWGLVLSITKLMNNAYDEVFRIGRGLALEYVCRTCIILYTSRQGTEVAGYEALKSGWGKNSIPLVKIVPP